METKKEKIIYKTYKAFYKKEPIFNRDNLTNLTIEIQSMAYLLNEYGVSIGTDGFCYQYKDLNIPMSMDIQDIIVEKLIGNNNVLNDDSLKFSKSTEKTIGIIGGIVRYVMNSSSKPLETLKNVTNVLYVKKYVSPTSNEQELIEQAKCTKKDLIVAEQLVEIINQERCKDNFDKTNIENINEMIESEIQTPYGTYMNESGNKEEPKITEESRKKLAKSLIR